jgi:hypothetical protein
MRGRGGRENSVSTVEETGARLPGAKAGPEPDAKDDLKSLPVPEVEIPVPEVEKRLSSSPDGLSRPRRKSG